MSVLLFLNLILYDPDIYVPLVFPHSLGMTDLPQSVAFFQSVEIDRVLRKESQADYVTPSNPHGLAAGYGVPPGRSVGIAEALQDIAGDEDMGQWPWHKRK